MDDLENKSNTAADTRKVYEAPALESLGSLESHTQNGPWAVARWVDEGHVFILLGSQPVDKLASLF